MSLIAMAVYSTVENRKDEYLRRTLESLSKTVDFTRHRLILSVNSFTEETLKILVEYSSIITGIIYNHTNIGTAEAINKVWKERQPGENAIKMDDDVEIHQVNWVDLMDECISRDPKIGQVGLKRKDCMESPDRTDWLGSTIHMLPHTPGEKWIIIEQANHIMGTCVMHSSSLLDTIGYMKQPRLYGFDDVLMSLRSRLAGFKNVFIPHIEIDHIDSGETSYQKWKERSAGEDMIAYTNFSKYYESGKLPLYYNPFK